MLSERTYFTTHHIRTQNERPADISCVHVKLHLLSPLPKPPESASVQKHPELLSPAAMARQCCPNVHRLNAKECSLIKKTSMYPSQSRCFYFQVLAVLKQSCTALFAQEKHINVGPISVEVDLRGGRLSDLMISSGSIHESLQTNTQAAHMRVELLRMGKNIPSEGPHDNKVLKTILMVIIYRELVCVKPAPPILKNPYVMSIFQ